MQPQPNQQDCDETREMSEDESTHLTICEKTDSSTPNNTELETEQDPAMTSHQYQTCQPCDSHKKKKELKLIVRSQYWGRNLHGRTCQNAYTNMDVKAPKVISSQAVLYNADGYWGCCPSHGKRVLELKEDHFTSLPDGQDQWDLFHVRNWMSTTDSVHDFFFLPKNQTRVDLQRNMQFNRWRFVGTCTPGNIRSGIDFLLRPLLESNNNNVYQRVHAHIDIMMDEAQDPDTPRSRKLNNEKLRSERKNKIDSTHQDDSRQESSVSTDDAASAEHSLTEQESAPSTMSQASNQNNKSGYKSVGAPSIPSTINNDSLFSRRYPTPNQTVNPGMAYPDTGWTPEHMYVTHGFGQSASDAGNHIFWQQGKDVTSSGGLPHQPYPYVQQIAPIVHPGQFLYPAPSSMMHSGVAHLHHQSMGAEIQQHNVDSMQLHSHYTRQMYSPSVVGTQPDIAYESAYPFQYVSPYMEYYAEGGNISVEAVDQVLPEYNANATAINTSEFSSPSAPSVSESSSPSVSTCPEAPSDSKPAGVSQASASAEQPEVRKDDSVVLSSCSPSLPGEVTTNSSVGDSAADSTDSTNKFDGVPNPQEHVGHENDKRGLRV